MSQLTEARPSGGVRRSSYAGGTACATTASPAFSEVGQAVPPASPACGRLFHGFSASVPIDGAVLSAAGNEARIQVPDKPGAYRIFVYVHDPAGKAATANVPILAVPPAAR
jgi:hypothetical protein